MKISFGILVLLTFFIISNSLASSETIGHVGFFFVYQVKTDDDIEIHDDFQYHYKQIKPWLIKYGLSISYHLTTPITLNLQEGKTLTIQKDDLGDALGFIFANLDGTHKIFYGVYTDVDILTEASNFFSFKLGETEDRRKYIIDPVTTAINGIKITTTERDILKRLGKPKSIESSHSEVVNKPSKNLYYDGMKIYLIEGDIYNLSCTGNKCQTDRGVKVGDSKTKVIKIYGPGNPPYKGATHDSLTYPLKGIDSSLTFSFKDNKVVEIEFFVNYV